MTSSSPSAYPVRDAFRRFAGPFLDQHPETPYYRQKVANCIMKCKSGELGYNISVCEACGHPLIHAVSCNNRSCPCCQSAMEKKWELERNTELIEGIAYYHVVFTIPHQLNSLIRLNLVPLLDLMFHCVHKALLKLCADPRHAGMKPGIVSVLHTWGQKLSFHPHIHVCISGGGLTPEKKFKETVHKGFFLPRPVVGDMFRGMFLCALKKLYNAGKLNLSGLGQLIDPVKWQSFIDSLFEKEWLPFIKETFNGNGNAVQYLARYSYRTAIANSRILSVTDDKVTFRCKDYADGGKEKILTVTGEEFIGLFLQYVLPPGFHRVRFAGFLSNCKKAENLKLISLLRSTVYTGNPYSKMKMKDLLQVIFGKDVCACPVCSGKVTLHIRAAPLHRVEAFIREHSCN